MYGLRQLLGRVSIARVLRWGIGIALGGGATFLLAGCSALAGGEGQTASEPYEFSIRLRAGPPREASSRTPLICKPDGSCSVAQPPAVTKGS